MDRKHNEISRHSKTGWFALSLGAIVALWGVPNAILGVEGRKSAGGAAQYLGVEHWQDHLRFSLWGFSFPIACMLLLMGMALRRQLPSRFAVGLPLALIGTIVYVGFVPYLPKVIPGYFGTLGVINAASVIVVVYLCMDKIRAEDPLPGLLRALGYVSFNATTWFTCGLMSTPGMIVYENMPHDQGVINDLAQKIALAWALSWTLTAAGFVLERRAAAAKARRPEALPEPALEPARELALTNRSL